LRRVSPSIPKKQRSVLRIGDICIPKLFASFNHFISGAKTTFKFLENDIICKYGVPKFVLTDNGGEWATKFDVMCKDYGIHHQHTTPQWPQCNGMVECLIKTIKHGIIVLFAMPENVDCWDEQLAKVMFGYKCVMFDM
jgi:hypothetical protein